MFKYILPVYPLPNQTTGQWNISDLEALSSLEEFSGDDVTPQIREPIPLIPGVPLRHQRAVARLMSGLSGVRELLLVHDMGTGKTCTAIQSIERNIGDAMFGMRRGLVILPSAVIERNFKRELEDNCTTRYHPDSKIRSRDPADRFFDQNSTRIVPPPKRAAWKNFYTFTTFEKFAKTVEAMSNAEIASKWNSTFVVVDEVHTIGRPNGQRYLQLDRFLSLIPNKKTLLLTGTPIRDSPSDFAIVFNLLLPEGQKLDMNNFVERYLPAPSRMPTQELVNKVAGRVSFLAADPIDTVVFDAGQAMPGHKTKIVASDMSPFQAQIYIQNMMMDRADVECKNKDNTRDVAYLRARQSCRFVFPDGSFGKEGYVKYMNNDRPTREFMTALTTLYRPGEAPRQAVTDAERYEAVSRYSKRYADMALDVIQAGKRREKSLVYDDLVRGSGLFVFAAVLDAFGCRRGASSSTGGINYEILVGDLSDAKILEIVNVFNEPSNAQGKHLMCILGSRVIAVGLTFKDVLHEHVVAHWNDSETRQVIARGIRAGSHKAYKSIHADQGPVRVTVYRRASKYPDSDDVKDSIDLLMYSVSESKRELVDAVVNAAKTTAITCRSFSKRNNMNPSQLDPNTGLPWANELESCSIPKVLSPLNPENAVATEMWDTKRLGTICRALVDMRVGTLSTLATVLQKYGHRYDALVDIPYILHLARTGTVLNPDDAPTSARLVLHDMDGVLYVSKGADLYGDSFMSQYTTRLVSGRGGNEQSRFDNELIDFADKTLAQRIKNNDFPDTWEIPPRVMQVLIQDCLTTKILGAELAPDNTSWPLVDSVLDRYRDFWTEVEEISKFIQVRDARDMPPFVAAVWYTSGVSGEIDAPAILPTSKFYDNYRSAYTSWELIEDRDSVMALVKIRDSRRLRRENRARRYGLNNIGLVNPVTNDFCISSLSSGPIRGAGVGRVDRRTLSVGKICRFYDKSGLLKLALAVNPGADARELEGLSREHLCLRIMEGYKRLDLTQLDMSCGVQTKKR